MTPQSPLSAVTLPLPFGDVAADDVDPAVSAHIATAQSRLDAIPTAERTYDGTLGALDRATSELDFAMGVASHLEAVDGTPAMRASYNKVLPKVSAFASKILLSEPLYRALREFSQTQEAASLPPARRRFLTKTLDDFR